MPSHEANEYFSAAEGCMLGGVLQMPGCGECYIVAAGSWCGTVHLSVACTRSVALDRWMAEGRVKIGRQGVDTWICGGGVCELVDRGGMW